MNLKTTAEHNTATIAIDGRLDTMTSPELIAEIGKVAPANDKLILDVSGLEYISSAGVRALVTAHKQMAKKGGFTVKSPSKNVLEIIKLTGLTAILNIQD